MSDQVKKILIIEDETSLLKVLEDRFLQEGFIVLKATDGVQGYNVALESHPDIILLDIVLPLMSGLEILKKIKKNDDTKSIPVIILTNLADIESLNKAMENENFNDYLVKSDWKIEDVVKKVKDKLNI